MIKNYVPEAQKFEIIMDLKTNKTKTFKDMHKYIETTYNISLKKATLRKWIKVHKIPYKPVKKVSQKSQDNIKNLQRLKAITMIVKNLCIELDTRPPKQLCNLFEGIKNDLEELTGEEQTNKIEGV